MRTTNEIGTAVHEHLAREAKREKLVEAFDAYLRREEIDPNSAEALAKIERLDGFAWLTLSKLAACNPPSETTRELVVVVYRARASRFPGRVG